MAVLQAPTCTYMRHVGASTFVLAISPGLELRAELLAVAIYQESSTCLTLGSELGIGLALELWLLLNS